MARIDSSSGGGRGRGRSRQDPSLNIDENGNPSIRGDATPSRHLWVGNLAPRVTHTVLSEHFLRFGDLDGIVFHTGRSYAFVNYKREEDAVLAMRALQGVVIAGSPLKIEFQKGEKSMTSPIDEEDVPNLSERRYVPHGDAFPSRDSRVAVSETFGDERSSEPSEVLWIGFPAYLDVDEEILRRAFFPFGDIEKITMFPGRSYVHYRSVVAACRAKEALQGKLFNNPHVTICYARNDMLLPERGRSFGGSHLHFKSNTHSALQGCASEDGRREMHYDRPMEEFPLVSPRFFTDMEMRPRESSFRGISRQRLTGSMTDPASSASAYGSPRFQSLGPDRRISEEPYEHYRNSPVIDKVTPREDYPSQRPRKGPHYQDSWGMEDDTYPLPKKIRLDPGPDKELPEYPLFGSQRERLGPSVQDLSEHYVDRNYTDPNAFGYKGYLDKTTDQKRYSDNTKISVDPDKDDEFYRVPAPNIAPSPIREDPSKLQRQMPPFQKSLNEEWKWEGTIAKGGTAICRARCFPVGKVLDFMLPEYLDCTARTGLDMLEKHFYQAANSWVVFFVPETDSDIVFYNEFMHYLGEKNRAAVAKLGDKTTLFLVPPSDFSEHILKVPGKMSISGVILKFQQANSNFSTVRSEPEVVKRTTSSFGRQTSIARDLGEDDFRANHISPDRISARDQNHFSSSFDNGPSTATFPTSSTPSGAFSYPVSVDPVDQTQMTSGDIRYGQPQRRHPSTLHSWPPQDIHIPSTSIGNSVTQVANIPLQSSNSPMGLGNNELTKNMAHVQGVSSSNHIQRDSDTVLLGVGRPHQFHDNKPQAPLPAQPSLHSAQFAQLAALLEQQKQLGVDPAAVSVASQVSGDQRAQPSSRVNQTVNPEQHATQLPNSMEAETDPEKRLQATLQLAAALLQQIQQQSKSGK